MSATSFWPTKTGPAPIQPIDLLREQADLVSRYDASLEGRVTVSYADSLDPVAIISLYIINNNLRGYSYRLLSFEAGNNVPAITLRLHLRTGTHAYAPVPATDLSQFADVLRQALNGEDTRRILDWLVSMGNVMDDYRKDLV